MQHNLILERLKLSTIWNWNETPHGNGFKPPSCPESLSVVPAVSQLSSPGISSISCFLRPSHSLPTPQKRHYGFSLSTVSLSTIWADIKKLNLWTVCCVRQLKPTGFYYSLPLILIFQFSRWGLRAGRLQFWATNACKQPREQAASPARCRAPGLGERALVQSPCSTGTWVSKETLKTPWGRCFLQSQRGRAPALLEKQLSILQYQRAVVNWTFLLKYLFHIRNSVPINKLCLMRVLKLWK